MTRKRGKGKSEATKPKHARSTRRGQKGPYDLRKRMKGNLTAPEASQLRLDYAKGGVDPDVPKGRYH